MRLKTKSSQVLHQWLKALLTYQNHCLGLLPQTRLNNKKLMSMMMTMMVLQELKIARDAQQEAHEN
jgi:hypothetical protein